MNESFVIPSPAASAAEVRKQQKKIAHLTELLGESELNIQRLTDQSQVLKDEIRRLEGNWTDTSKNMEYLKNVLIKASYPGPKLLIKIISYMNKDCRLLCK